jgi:hypothetical protein
MKPPQKELRSLEPDPQGNVSREQVLKVNNENSAAFYKVVEQVEALQSWIRKINAGASK